MSDTIFRASFHDPQLETPREGQGECEIDQKPLDLGSKYTQNTTTVKTRADVSVPEKKAYA